MDTHLTGSNLIRVETGDLIFTISGDSSSPYINKSDEKKCSKVNIRKAPAHSKCVVKGSDSNGTIFVCDPLFYEQRNYEVYIEHGKNDKVRFVHDNHKIADKVQSISSNFPVIGGVINFNNDIGFSTLSVEVNGNIELSIEIEVFPSKIDYKEDYQAMLRDIESEVYNLAYDMLDKTYQNLDTIDIPKDQQSPVEYLTLFKYVYQKLQNAMTVIESYPHHKLEKIQEVLPAHKAKNCDVDMIKWMRKHPNMAHRNTAGDVRYDRVLVTKKQVSIDTLENRLVKHILTNTSKTLTNIKALYHKNIVDGQYSGTTSTFVDDTIDSWCNYINNKIEFSFLKNVSELNRTQSMSLVFAMAPGYRELYKCYVILQKGLSLFGDLYQLSLKDVAILYEYWCYIKLNSLVSHIEGFDIKKGTPIAIDRGGLFVTMKKGVESIVEYYNPEKNVTINLAYNREYNRGSTNKGTIVTQKPDNVFSLIRHDGNSSYEYVFDAKYKIDYAANGSAYKTKYNSPGPKEEDINTMHRYRDAIVHKNKVTERYERDMYGAYVLFPYNDEEEYKKHDFYKSIDEVNIGALPFLPSHTKLVDEFINKLINAGDDDSSRNIIMPSGKVAISNPDYIIGDSLFAKYNRG